MMIDNWPNAIHLDGRSRLALLKDVNTRVAAARACRRTT